MSDPKTALQNLMQYVFDRDAVEARDALHEAMVEMILSAYNKPVTVNTILHEIKRQLGIDIEISTLTDIVSKLVTSGAVKKDEKTGSYVLEWTRKKELQNIVHGRQSNFKGLERKFLSTFRKHLGKADSKREKVALDYFYSFFTQLFCWV